MFNTNLTETPTANAITGILTLFIPYNEPFIVWLSAIKTIDIANIFKIPAPSDAVGYNILKIGPAKVIYPMAHGTIIIIEANSENAALFLAKL